MRPRYLYAKKFYNKNLRILISTTQLIKIEHLHIIITLCLSSSGRASILTLAQGTSPGHQGGRVDSLPHPGFPRPIYDGSI